MGLYPYTGLLTFLFFSESSLYVLGVYCYRLIFGYGLGDASPLEKVLSICRC